VPGAGCAAGVLDGEVLDPVDCAPSPVASANASANAVSDAALKPLQAVFMTNPPRRPAEPNMPLRSTL
jgi:hypothetical protein